MGDNPLTSKTKVLITGASGQLGSALVEHFLNKGAFVYATDIHAAPPSHFEALAKKFPSLCAYHTLDVTKESSIRAVKERTGRIDVLVNNAGIAVFTPFEKRSEQELDDVMAVNIKGTILCSKVFAEDMTAGSSIINIGSIYGVVPADKTIYGDSGRNSSEIYAATKAGVIHFTKYLAAYLGERGIRVNAVSPGGIFNDQREVFVKNYVQKTPLGRMATTEDIVGVVFFLASGEAGYVTGQNIVVDGGFTLNQ